MPIVPLVGHRAHRERLAAALARGVLPSSLLLQGSRGIGKQRLAIWVAQLLLCDAPGAEPCGACSHCRHVGHLRHPDLHWYFPRPRLKDSDPSLEDVAWDYGDAVAERARSDGLYPTPSGSDAIYVATVRAIVQQATRTPALARRKVFVIGDAERMVPQEGSEQAANAFLKLLEEPPANTNIILTTSEPGALLPTVRSRVVAMRLAPLPDGEMRELLAHSSVAQRLEADGVPGSEAERIRASAGAAGRMLSGDSITDAGQAADRILASLSGKPSAKFEAAWFQASAKARGAFADSLDELTVRLHDRARAAARQGDAREALAAARAVDVVEVAKERVQSNVSPQLVTASLVRELGDLLG